MVFDIPRIVGVILFAFFIWLGGVTVVLYRSIRHYRRLTHGATNRSLQDILEKLLTRQERTESALKEAVGQIGQLQRDGVLHIQKVGTVRFNPFADTGGRQSFVLALLDEHDTGVVLSSLFTRTETRWYLKEVVRGKPADQKLSDEELHAVQLAQKQQPTAHKTTKIT